MYGYGDRQVKYIAIFSNTDFGFGLIQNDKSNHVGRGEKGH